MERLKKRIYVTSQNSKIFMGSLKMETSSLFQKIKISAVIV